MTGEKVTAVDDGVDVEFDGLEEGEAGRVDEAMVIRSVIICHMNV